MASEMRFCRNCGFDIETGKKSETRQGGTFEVVWFIIGIAMFLTFTAATVFATMNNPNSTIILRRIWIPSAVVNLALVWWLVAAPRGRAVHPTLRSVLIAFCLGFGGGLSICSAMALAVR